METNGWTTKATWIFTFIEIIDQWYQCSTYNESLYIIEIKNIIKGDKWHDFIKVLFYFSKFINFDRKRFWLNENVPEWTQNCTQTLSMPLYSLVIYTVSIYKSILIWQIIRFNNQIIMYESVYYFYKISNEIQLLGKVRY